MQQTKKWMSDSRSGWRVRHLLRQFDGMVITFLILLCKSNLSLTYLLVKNSKLTYFFFVPYCFIRQIIYFSDRLFKMYSLVIKLNVHRLKSKKKLLIG